MTQQHTRNPSGNSEPTVPVGRVVVCCLAILSAAAAVPHFGVASENFQAHRPFGVLMLVAAWLQVMWAVTVIVRTSPPVLWGGAVFNAGVVVAELAARPAGEAVENGLCIALGAVAAAGRGWLLTVRADHPVRRQHLVTVPASAGGVAVAVLGVTLATTTPAVSGTSAQGLGLRVRAAVPRRGQCRA
jgi:hypothetical protein